MSEQKVLIDCRDAALGYEGRPIWEHLTFQVRRGDYLCIVGDNGSGKSTLLKSMLGLLRPLSGEIRLDESLRRGAIGYLPQQTKAQKDFPATVTEVVRSGFLSSRGMRFFYTPKEKRMTLLWKYLGIVGFTLGIFAIRYIIKDLPYYCLLDKYRVYIRSVRNLLCPIYTIANP